VLYGRPQRGPQHEEVGLLEARNACFQSSESAEWRPALWGEMPIQCVRLKPLGVHAFDGGSTQVGINFRANGDGELIVAHMVEGGVRAHLLQTSAKCPDPSLRKTLCALRACTSPPSNPRIRVVAHNRNCRQVTPLLTACCVTTGPAERSGQVMAGDILGEVNGTSVHRSPLSAVSASLLGEDGSEVAITFYRDGKAVLTFPIGSIGRVYNSALLTLNPQVTVKLVRGKVANLMTIRPASPTRESR